MTIYGIQASDEYPPVFSFVAKPVKIINFGQKDQNNSSLSPLPSVIFPSTVEAASQTSGNITKMTASLWFRLPQDTIDQELSLRSSGRTLTVPILSPVEFSDGANEISMSLTWAPGEAAAIEALITTTRSGYPYGFGISAGGSYGLAAKNKWHHLFCAFDLTSSAADGGFIFDLWLDGKPAADPVNSARETAWVAGLYVASGGGDFGLPYDASFDNTDRPYMATLEFAEVWVDYSVYLDPATSLDKFRRASGLPKNLGANGQAPTGSPPTYFLTGGQAQFGSNSGEGDATTATGAFVDATPIASSNLPVARYTPPATFINQAGGDPSQRGLSIASQSEADQSKATISFWFCLPIDTNTGGNTLIDLGEVFSSVDDVTSTVIVSGGFLPSSPPYVPVPNDIAVFINTRIQYGDVIYSDGTMTAEMIFRTDPHAFVAGAWNHVFVSFDIGHTTGKTLNIYVNGVSSINSALTVDPGTSLAASVNGAGFFLPGDPTYSDGPAPAMGLSEVWVAYGVCLDPTTSLPAFRNSATGAPMPLGSDGSTPTGSAPTYYFTGGASDFPTNRGSGQQPTVTGALVDWWSGLVTATPE